MFSIPTLVEPGLGIAVLTMLFERGDFEWPSSVAFRVPAAPYFSRNDTVSETALGATTSLERERLALRVTVWLGLKASRCSGEVESGIVTTLLSLCLLVSISLLIPLGENAFDICWDTWLKKVFPFFVV